MSNDLVLMDMQPGIEKLLSRAKTRYLDCKDLTIEEAEQLGDVLAVMQEYVLFWCGDLARYSEARWPDTHQQVWPPTVSPGMLARTAGTCKAYPKQEDRQHACTYSQYKDVAGKPDRQKLLEGMVGQTTDESRGRVAERGPEPTVPKPEPKAVDDSGPRWLLAIDVNYFVNSFFFSGAGVESAMQVVAWVQRSVDRLREKGLSDVVCCFDSPENARKALTASWEDKYKDRPTKDPELAKQLLLARDLLQKCNYCCVSVDGMEADDVMASYAKQFDGRVTLLTPDKDCRQCLSAKCNILLDVTWTKDETSGDLLPEYKWLTAKEHTESKGIAPNRWIDYQCIMGDSTDGIRGVEGVGEKGAADLIKKFGTVEAVIQAAKDNDESITPKKRVAIIAFEGKLEVTRRLVTLRDDLVVPNSTRIA